MSKPRDATMKALLEIRPGDWLPFLGQPAVEPVTLIDADVSTVTAAGDKVIQVGGPDPWLLHLEFQAGGDGSLVRRMLQYNVLLDVRHDLPVRSVAILLRPSANSSVPSDVYVRQLPDGQRTLEFRCGVVRVWQLPVEPVLQGGLAVLPLAPLCDVDDAALPAVIRRMDQRLRAEAEPATGGQLMNAAFVLAGLRLPPTTLAQLFAGVLAMRESSGYQLILAEGRREEARRMLFLIGEEHLGEPDHAVRTAIENISNVEQLEELGKRVLKVNSWAELLGQTGSRSRTRRKK